jgi:hypothetical protein
MGASLPHLAEKSPAFPEVQTFVLKQQRRGEGREKAMNCYTGQHCA